MSTLARLLTIALLALIWFTHGLRVPLTYVRDSRLFSAGKDPNGDPPRRTRSILTKSKVKNEPTMSLLEPRRRKKVNKYASFSKAARKKTLESVEEAMSQSKERERQFSKDPGAAVRGTTVPTASASPKMKSTVAKFDSNRSIVPSDPFTFGYVEIGTVGPPHGIKGELKVSMHNTDFALNRLTEGSLLYIKKPSRRSPRPVRIISARRQVDNAWLVQFENILNRASAMAFRSYKVYVRAEDRPDMTSDEYLVRDLVGLNCLANNEEGEVVSVAVVNGVVPPDELCDPGVRHLMHAQLELLLHSSQKLCLVPLVPSIVLSVDLKQKQLVLEPPSGLLDYTYEEKPRRVVIRGFLPEEASLSAEERRGMGK